jgi:hypothetical protein
VTRAQAPGGGGAAPVKNRWGETASRQLLRSLYTSFVAENKEYWPGPHRKSIVATLLFA